MINTNQSKLTPTFNRNTDKGGTQTYGNNYKTIIIDYRCCTKLTYKKIEEKHSFSTKYFTSIKSKQSRYLG